MSDFLNTPFAAGWDSVVSGANTENCSFTWFSTPERRAEWERGVREAKATESQPSDQLPKERKGSKRATPGKERY